MNLARQNCLDHAYGAVRLLRNSLMALALSLTTVAAEPVTVVALGDSLTQGYGLPAQEGFVPQLQAWLEAQGVEATITNAGVSGDTSAGGLSRLEWSLSGEVEALIVNLGGNDVLRGLDPDVTRANLEGILEGAQERNLPVLLIGMPAPGNFGPDFKTRYDAIFPDLSERFDTLLVTDFFAPLRAESKDPGAIVAYMQGDGIHPNAEGVARIVEAVGPVVMKLIVAAQP
ncbi:MAG: arylesterase [Pseudorhodobacter sp.]